MNYFYTYVEDEQEVSSLQQIQTEMQRKNAAVCFFDYGSTAQWEQLQAVWKQSDILYIQDIAHLASEVQELKQALPEYSQPYGNTSLWYQCKSQIVSDRSAGMRQPCACPRSTGFPDNADKEIDNTNQATGNQRI